MNSIFLRIYGGMLLILITVSLLALLSIRLINDVRAEDYRERIASGTFRLMADNLERRALARVGGLDAPDWRAAAAERAG
jgi:hypothetical protein